MDRTNECTAAATSYCDVRMILCNARAHCMIANTYARKMAKTTTGAPLAGLLAGSCAGTFTPSGPVYCGVRQLEIEGQGCASRSTLHAE